jgi:lipopolysaccharide transport system permease protein
MKGSSITNARKSESAVREIVITPASGLALRDFTELYRYRGLLAALVKRQIRTEYDSLRLGILWGFARPVLMTLVFVGLRRVTTMATGVEIAYPLYLYTGLIFWFWFTDAASNAAESLHSNAGLIQKVYFPRLISPLVPIASSLFTLAIALLPVIPAAFVFGEPPGWKLILLPIVVAQVGTLALGIGLAFAALTIVSRDWQRFLSLAFYVGLFLSPVIYTPQILPESIRAYAHFNPMAGSLLAFRATLFDAFPLPLLPWLYSGLFSLAALALGILMFRRVERALVDTI